MKYCNTGIINCKDCWDWDKDRCKVGLHNPNDKVAIAIAARDKWWMERLFQKCPHATQFRIAGECILCLREIKKEVGL
jgi:hypothetical protein